MKGNYESQTTAEVKSYINYEKDFEDPGQFTEEDVDNEICLMTMLWPGKYDGKQWIEQSDTDNESYMIYLYYYNKNNVNVGFDASYGQVEGLQKSFDFVKTAAKKFFLINVDFSRKELGRDFPKEKTTWEEIEKLIAKIKSASRDVRTGNSWSKKMTLAEAKKLFDYLKIGVDFPH